MPKLKNKRVTEPLTMIVSSRVDIRKFARIMYKWKVRDIHVEDVSGAVRRIINSYADSLAIESEIESQIVNDTHSAESFLVAERLMRPRLNKDGSPSGRYTGQDKSTHYEKVRQYDSEELRIMDKVVGMELSNDEEGIQKHLEILSEVMNGSVDKVETITNNPLENKTGVCIVCGGSIDTSKFDNDPVMMKYFERSNKQVCFECLEKQI